MSSFSERASKVSTASTIFRRLAVLATSLALVTTLALPPAAHGASRIKDISDFEGIRDNMLVGYGLVVGLNGTGDSLTKSPFTQQSLTSMLERLGVNTRDATLNTDNVAAVMVTVSPPFGATVILLKDLVALAPPCANAGSRPNSPTAAIIAATVITANIFLNKIPLLVFM